MEKEFQVHLDVLKSRKNTISCMDRFTVYVQQWLCGFWTHVLGVTQRKEGKGQFPLERGSEDVEKLKMEKKVKKP